MKTPTSIALALSLTFLCVAPVATAASREIVLGEQDRYTLQDSNEWRIEVLSEQAGQFADVRVRPAQGSAVSLTLYFLADPVAKSRFNTPAKMSDALTKSATPYLRRSLERNLSLKPLTLPGNSFGFLTVLTAADFQGLPGEFRYQTRGMLRLSAEAALGFTLLSNTINAPEYTQALGVVYDFVNAPRSTSQSRPRAQPEPPAPTRQPTANDARLPEPARAATPASSSASSSQANTSPASGSHSSSSASASGSSSSQTARSEGPLPAAPPSTQPVVQQAPSSPATTAAPVVTPTTPSAPSQPLRKVPGDRRDCLSLSTNADIIRCANQKR